MILRRGMGTSRLLKYYIRNTVNIHWFTMNCNSVVGGLIQKLRLPSSTATAAAHGAEPVEWVVKTNKRREYQSNCRG